MSIFAELWAFMRAHKKYCLTPTLSILLFGGLIILAQGTPVAPFISTLF